ncbi:MAG: hypothetical protein NT166_21855 [Candidatus Aminicenantes bacterium]|nr:hypothetical protein [Candidatus Aminicenantes bacterium]
MRHRQGQHFSQDAIDQDIDIGPLSAAAASASLAFVFYIRFIKHVAIVTKEFADVNIFG